MPSKPTDAGSLRDRLTSVEQQIRIVGLGEGGLIALSFGNLTPQIADVAPHWILGALVTLLIIAGALLARAWIAVHLASGWLDNRSSAAVPNTATLTQDPGLKALHQYTLASAIFRTAIYVLVAAGITYLIATWIWVIGGGHPRLAGNTIPNCTSSTQQSHRCPADRHAHKHCTQRKREKIPERIGKA